MSSTDPRYSSQIGRAAHSARPGRESLSKRLGRVARQIAARDHHACVYCGATAASSGAHLHLDHLTPRSAGGLDVASNLVLACRSCNSRRQARTLAQWAAVSPELVFTARSIRAQARRSLPAQVAA
jgi:5-methylcytosine-specific restriction endonuclease McrA